MFDDVAGGRRGRGRKRDKERAEESLPGEPDSPPAGRRSPQQPPSASEAAETECQFDHVPASPAPENAQPVQERGTPSPPAAAPTVLPSGTVVPLSGPAEVKVTGPASRRAAAFSNRLRAEQEPRPRSVSPISALLREMTGEGQQSPPPPPAPIQAPPAAICDPEAVLAVARNLSQLGVQQPVSVYPEQYGPTPSAYGAPPPQSYGASPSYGVPSYGSQPPYGTPSQRPPVSYGSPPQGPPVPYGSPPQGPPVSYGSPPQGPPVSYGSPSQGPPVSCVQAEAQHPPYGSPPHGQSMTYASSQSQQMSLQEVRGAPHNSPLVHSAPQGPPAAQSAPQGPPAAYGAPPPDPRGSVGAAVAPAAVTSQPPPPQGPPAVPQAAVRAPLPPSPQKSTELLRQQPAPSGGPSPTAEAERGTAEPGTSKAGLYVPPGKRALLGRRRSPPPPPEPPRPAGPIQCVTFVDGKAVMGPVDDSMFHIQDIRLKEGKL
ncbi:basic salivary proline-rich protein 1-like [Amphibalanus amphitrite]|uniref:basic salivary proline-rich protein 1-like n=1 Tax=Amphibalanus amphitrite TaxID=1232801 RepID=UPI001C91CAD9|nr:basic salivary proline-rich protein 1-like [Amphibalanus amphitrite]